MALLLVSILFLSASLAINGNIEEMRNSLESYGKTWYNNAQELEEIVKSLEVSDYDLGPGTMLKLNRTKRTACTR